MNLKAEKLRLIEWIARLEDISIINKLKQVQDENSSMPDLWEELSESDKQSIERGMRDIEAGSIHSHETVRKLYEKYL